MVGGVTEDEVIKIKRNPWADNLFRPLLVTVMIMCLSISLVNLVQLINPAWRGTYFLAGMLFTTVEAIYSYRVLRHYRSRGISVTRYRLAEAALLILVLMILGFMDTPLSAIGTELQNLWSTPAIIFNPEFYTTLLLAFLVWMAATYTVADLEALHDPYLDNRMILSSLTERFFWGGIILVVISGITHWGARAGPSVLLDWQRPSLGGIILNVLVYFMLGLVLISQVNLTRHQVRWRIQKIAVAPGLVQQWAKYGLVFLAAITLIAFLLPTHYSMGFLAAAGLFILFIIGVIIFISQLLLLLVLLAINFLLSFLASSPVNSIPAAMPPPPLPPLIENADPAALWLEVLRSLIFWGVTLVALGYLLKIYLEDHPELLEQLKSFRPLGLLLNLLSLLWQLLGGWAQTGWDMIPKSVSKKESQPGLSITPLRNWLGLRRLSRRERILYYYLNILQRALKTAPARKNYQTPYEYEPVLSDTVPTVQPEIHELTDVFVTARYSQTDFTEEQVGLVKVLWQRVRQALRGQAVRPKNR